MNGGRRGRVPAEILERVRAASDIVEIVQQYVALKRAGRSFKGLCPFHTEKTPSFTVSPDRQMYYCFGCQRGGDVFRFVMEHDGTSFAETLRLLGARAGIEVPAARAESDANDALYAVAERTAAFYHEQLLGKGGERGRAYLDQRGIDPEIARRFRLGLAPDRWDALAQALGGTADAEAALLALGLVARRSGGGTAGSYDLFRNRLVFPIQSLSGRVVGLGGRILPGGDDDRAPKYLNSKDSPIYHKNQVLYGLVEARAAIRRQDAAILTEGYLDFLSLFQRGIEHVVASCGTAFGPQQAALLHRYTHRAYILGDSDPAGRRAAVRTAGMLLEHGFLVHVVELPTGHDPDTFVREYGAAALETRLREAAGYIAYMKSLVDRRAGDLSVKERVVRHVLEDLSRVSDPLLQELYSKELSRSFALSEGTVAAALERQQPRAAPATTPPPAAEVADAGAAVSVPAAMVPAAVVPAAVREARRGLLQLGLVTPGLASRMAVDLEPEDFGDGVERRVFEALCAAGPDGHWRDHVASREDDSFGSQLEILGPLPGEPERLYQDYTARVLDARRRAASAEIDRRLGEAESRLDTEAQAELLKQRQSLARDRRLRRSPPDT
jgi:DNA primase